MNGHETQSMALFCDFENVALGVEEARYERFDIGLVLEKLLVKGSIVVKKAYCDWERYKGFKAAMHQASFELIEIPHVRQSGKNSADIRLVVDALDLCYTKSHVDTFVIISGDSDFSPLVSKLRENNKTVIGIGVKNSTSDLLIANCDEFIYYDDLVRARTRPRTRTGKAAGKTSARAADKVTEKATEKAAEKAAEKATDRAATEAVDAGGTPRPDSTTEATSDKASTRKTAARSSAAGRKAGAGRSQKPAPGIDEDLATAEKAAAGSEAATVATATAATGPGEPGDAAGSEEDRVQRAMDLILDTCEALLADRGAEEKLWGSMIKQALKRRNPGFSESYYGYRSFNGLLEEAQARHLVALELDEKSGGYRVQPL